MESSENKVAKKQKINKKLILPIIGVVVLLVAVITYSQMGSDDESAPPMPRAHFSLPKHRDVEAPKKSEIKQVKQWQNANNNQENSASTLVTKPSSTKPVVNDSGSKSAKKNQNSGVDDVLFAKSNQYSEIQNQIYLAKLKNTLLKVRLEAKELQSQLNGQRNVVVQAITNIAGVQSAILIVNGKVKTYHNGDQVFSGADGKHYVIKSISGNTVVISNGSDEIRESL